MPFGTFGITVGKQQVDVMVKKAIDAGGSIYRDAEDHGWMYGKSFADLDGHQREILYMDDTAIPET